MHATTFCGTKIVAWLCVFLLGSGNLANAAFHPYENDDRTPPLMINDNDPLPKLSAMSACVMVCKTGQIIYERDANSLRPPASTTKMMTLLTALSEGDMDDIVRVSKNAAAAEGSTLWLDEDDKIRLEELLTGMIMVSGNDGATAVAEHIGGSVGGFARMMNQKAAEIGATRTHFTNPSGLPDDKHLSTARDLAIIACCGYENKKFSQIVATKEKYYPWVKDPTHFMRNENQLLWFYDGANGVKTGYTEKAGRCLVSGAKRDGVQIVAVVLDSLYLWEDSMMLLDYGFSHIHSQNVVRRGDSCGKAAVLFGTKKSVALKTAEEIALPFVNNQEHFEKRVNTPKNIVAPIKKGDPVGELEIYNDGKKIAATKIIAAENIERKSFFAMLVDLLKNLFR